MANTQQTTWKRHLGKWVSRLENALNHRRRQVSRKLRPINDVLVQPYISYGNDRHVELRGRVLMNRHIRAATAESTKWQNARATIKRMASREIPGARLEAQFCGQTRHIETDDQGYFRFRFECQPPRGRQWFEVPVKLLNPGRHVKRVAEATCEVMIPDAGSEFGVISDIDDTIVYSHATSTLQLFKLTLLKNAHTRVPFEGVAAFYRALCEGASGHAGNPIFYVSSSAWNLYDLLCQFMQVHEMPKGPIFLRDVGLEPTHLFKSSHLEHKRAIIDDILSTYPDMQFILIGDSGQKDAEIYYGLAQDYPGRIAAIYIRQAGRSFAGHVETFAEQAKADGIDMQLVADTAAAAEHAVARGFITADEVEQIRQQRQRDHDAPGDLRQMVSGE